MNEYSQRNIIKRHLLSGKSITPVEALQLCSCFRLASVIHRLRNEDGLCIKTVMVENKRGNSFAKYYIEK